jgi:hypothetical protein
VQAVAQQLPDVAAMVGDAGEPFDYGGHTLKRPVVVVEAVRAGTLPQRLVNAVQLLLVKAWGGPGGAALRSASSPPGAIGRASG